MTLPRPILASLLLWASLAAVPAAELHLVDGRTLEGADLWREGDEFLLQDAEGRVVAVPVALVARLAVTGGEEPPSAPPPARGSGKPEERAEGRDAPELPPAFVEGPRVPAGSDVRFRRPDESLAVFGEPARFARGVRSSHWRPQDGWREPGDVDFSPSRWARNVVDPFWRPLSGFPEGGSDAGRPARWSRGVVRTVWTPVDGFGDRH